jgi:FKBP-type peptidyl-prolyl cis-trans isomerase
MENDANKGNIYFYIFLGIIILVLLAFLYKNYKPIDLPVTTQENRSIEEEKKINNEEEVNKNNMNENNATSTEGVVKNGDTVFVHYTGTLENGKKFDSSVDRGKPFDFVVGAGMVIKGWDQGLLGMKVGEKKRLVLPPALAYGPAGITAPDGTVVIPQNATLIFDIELISIN